MTQDHRLSFRYPIELDIDLFRHSHRIGHFNTRNIGPLGLFVETGPLDVSRQDPVRIAFNLANGTNLANGIVVHRSIDGVGIRFTEVSPFVFHALDELLSIPDFSLARARYNQIDPGSVTAGSLNRSSGGSKAHMSHQSRTM